MLNFTKFTTSFKTNANTQNKHALASSEFKLTILTQRCYHIQLAQPNINMS